MQIIQTLIDANSVYTAIKFVEKSLMNVFISWIFPY